MFNRSSRFLSVVNGSYVVFLDVWDRTVTSSEDPEISSAALEGADTSPRTKAVWQIRAVPLSKGHDQSSVARLVRKVARQIELPALTVSPTPDSGYAGLENKVYRIKIHGPGGSKGKFGWSRDNESGAVHRYCPIAIVSFGKRPKSSKAKTERRV